MPGEHPALSLSTNAARVAGAATDGEPPVAATTAEEVMGRLDMFAVKYVLRAGALDLLASFVIPDRAATVGALLHVPSS
jgi:hypothetical protein